MSEVMEKVVYVVASAVVTALFSYLGVTRPAVESKVDICNTAMVQCLDLLKEEMRDGEP